MSAPKVAPEKFVATMEQELQKYLQSVMQAVNNAPDGEWLAGSEEQVRDLSADFRRQVFERAVQARAGTDAQRWSAAEAAFSPSAPPEDRQASAEQRPTVQVGADDQRSN